MTKIKYKIVSNGKYKYELQHPYVITTGIFPEVNIMTKYISLDTESILYLEAGYQWDGPSGFFTIHTENFIRGSLIHDALYQLMRDCMVYDSYRIHADNLLKKICRQDGMSRFRAWYVYRCVRMFGGKYAKCKP